MGVMILPSECRFETAGDESVCGPCQERAAKPFSNDGSPVDHPDCKNPNGCRCVAVMRLAPGQIKGFYMDGVPAKGG